MTEKKKPNFKRKDSHKYSKLGKSRKNKQKWKKPTGRDNKMREKKKGHPAVVSIGYKTNTSIRGKVEEKKPVYVYNIKDLENVNTNEIVIVGNVGMKKKVEITKVAKEKKIKIKNINEKKLMKKVKKKTTKESKK